MTIEEIEIETETEIEGRLPGKDGTDHRLRDIGRVVPLHPSEDRGHRLRGEVLILTRPVAAVAAADLVAGGLVVPLHL